MPALNKRSFSSTNDIILPDESCINGDVPPWNELKKIPVAFIVNSMLTTAAVKLKKIVPGLDKWTKSIENIFPGKI